MKGVRCTRLIKKLKSIPHVAYLKQPHFQLISADNIPTTERKIDDIDIADLLSDEEEAEFDSKDVDLAHKSNQSNKENIRPEKYSISNTNSSEGYRRPDFNSSTLFDPNLLAEFRKAVMEIRDEGPPLKLRKTSEEEEVDPDPLREFEDRCPPGGRDTIILYTTSLRGIRKTFEDCKSVIFLLKSLKVVFHERDVSMHLEFRDELWKVLEGRAIPPRLFVKGKYIGGADEVLGLHEQRRLLPLIKGLPVDPSVGAACDGCGGFGFVVCVECSGSRKIREGSGILQCRKCNENGLVVCSLCG